MTTVERPTLAEFLLARIVEVEQLAMSIVARHRDDAESNFTLSILADCDAKRRVVHRVSNVQLATYAVRDEVLGLLALPYAGHPDYRSEWGV